MLEKPMRPLITVIIPTFRRPHLLQRAIHSVINQGDLPLQICVYDNNSGDETRNVVLNLAEKDLRIKYFCHSENIGGLNNFIHGMAHVETEFFNFLSDDDYLLPGFYSRALATLQGNPRALFWVGMSLNIDENGTLWDIRGRSWEREGLFEPPEGFFAMTRGRSPTWTSMLFRKKAIDLYGLIDPGTLNAADLDYCLRLSQADSYIFEKYPASVLSLHNQSISSTQNPESFWPGWLKIIQNIEQGPNHSEDFTPKAVQTIKQDAKRMLFRRGANALAFGRLDFSRATADALEQDCNAPVKAHILRALSACCEHSSIFQYLYKTFYKQAENRLIQSRQALQAQYGHLILPTPGKSLR